MMSFSEALEALRNLPPARIRRAGWNGKGMHLMLFTSAGNPGFRDPGNFEPITLQDFIAMKTVQGTYVPWLASQTDLLSDDWEFA